MNPQIFYQIFFQLAQGWAGPFLVAPAGAAASLPALQQVISQFPLPVYAVPYQQTATGVWQQMQALLFRPGQGVTLSGAATPPPPPPAKRSATAAVRQLASTREGRQALASPRGRQLLAVAVLQQLARRGGLGRAAPRR